VIRASLATTHMVDIVTRVRPSARRVQGPIVVIRAGLATICLITRAYGVG